MPDQFGAHFSTKRIAKIPDSPVNYWTVRLNSRQVATPTLTNNKLST